MMPATDEILTIEPLPDPRMAGIAALVPRNTPLALMSIIRSQPSMVWVSTLPPFQMPALLTRMCSPPNRSIAVSTACCQSASLVTSRWTNTASPPASAISASTCWPSDSSTSPRTTFAPSEANRRASAAPIPLAPPLISATLPSSRMACLHRLIQVQIIRRCRSVRYTLRSRLERRAYCRD